jgi:hypothetical protein
MEEAIPPPRINSDEQDADLLSGWLNNEGIWTNKGLKPAEFPLIDPSTFNSRSARSSYARRSSCGGGDWGRVCSHVLATVANDRPTTDKTLHNQFWNFCRGVPG